MVIGYKIQFTGNSSGIPVAQSTAELPVQRTTPNERYTTIRVDLILTHNSTHLYVTIQIEVS